MDEEEDEEEAGDRENAGTSTEDDATMEDDQTSLSSSVNHGQPPKVNGIHDAH